MNASARSLTQGRRIKPALCWLLGAICLGVLLWESLPANLCWPSLPSGGWQRPRDGNEAWALYGWWGLLAAATIYALLSLSSSFWLKRQDVESSPTAPNYLPWQKWDYLCLGLLIALSLTLRLLVMDGPMHRDEQDNLVHQILGTWVAPTVKAAARSRPGRPADSPPVATQQRMLALIDQPQSRLRWEERSWTDTTLGSWAGNNAMPNSVAARFCNRVWQSLTGNSDRTFSVVALRVPALLAMTAAVGIFFALSRRWLRCLPAAAIATALFSLHPLIIRLGALSRGYAIAILAQLLCWYAYDRARECPTRWRWWFVGALSIWMSILSFPGMVYPSFFVVLTGLWVCVKRKEDGLLQRAATWTSAHLAAFGCWLPLGLPMLVQSTFAVTYNYPYKIFGVHWLPRFLGAGFGGVSLPTKDQMPAGLTSEALPDGLAAEVWASAPWGSLFIAAFVPALLLIGGWILFRRRTGIWVACTVAGAAIASFVYTQIQGRELLYWYSCYLTPVIPFCIASIWPPTNVSAIKWTKYRQPLCLLMAAFFVILSFPDFRIGRLGLFPSEKFESICYRYSGTYIATDAAGRSISFPVR